MSLSGVTRYFSSSHLTWSLEAITWWKYDLPESALYEIRLLSEKSLGFQKVWPVSLWDLVFFCTQFLSLSHHFFLYSFSFFVITILFLLLSIFLSLFFISASGSHLSFLLLFFSSSVRSFIHSEKAWLCSDLSSFCFLSFIYSISLPLSLSLSFLPFPVVSFWLSVLLSLSAVRTLSLSLSN